LTATTGTAGLRVLLVEDEPGDARLVQKMLSSAGEVTWKTSLREGLAHVEAAAVDVVLLDLNLPDSDGVATVEAFVRRAGAKPVVVLTGDAQDGVGVGAVHAGAEDFLGKDALTRQVLTRALRHATERHKLRSQTQTIVSRTVDATLVLAPTGEVLFANPAAVELLGRPLDDLLGRDPGLPAEARESGPLRIRRPDGAVREAEACSTRIEWEGAPAWLTSIRDLSAQRRAERAEGHLGLVLGQLPLVLWTADEELRLTWTLQGAARLLPGGEEVRRLDALLPDAPALVEAHRAALRSGHAELTFEAGGRRYECVLHDARARGVGVLGMALDVTERAELEEQLHQAQRVDAIGRLAGGIAHDFNNMLTAIGGFAELAAREVGADHPARRWLDRLLAGVERSATLTAQILAFARKQRLEPERVDLRRVAADTEELLARLLGERIRLRLALGEEPAFVEVDPARVQQVIINMAINARDAMPDGGELSIAVDLVELDAEAARRVLEAGLGRCARLVIRDTGAGMEPETRERIFEPFFTTKPTGEGTGLGLATAYGTVRQSGGAIRVESAPGEGTTFELYFPRVGPPEAADPEGRPVAPPRPPGGATVLVAEDEELVREVLTDVLESAGHTVLTAASGEEALERARAHGGPLDLVVSDVVMPGLAGPELARRLRAERPGLPVLLLSGYTGGSAARPEGRAGEVAFLEKPVGPAALLERVEALLSSRG